MTQLETITKGTYLNGILPNQPVEVIDTRWHGSDVMEITFRDAFGNPHNEILYRDNEAQLEIASASAPWSFTANPELFKLASEAYRLRLAYIFDPMMAVHISMIEPLPHQIMAVYEAMLPRQPLRYLLEHRTQRPFEKNRFGKNHPNRKLAVSSFEFFRHA
jgi:hypothetical protein